MIKSAKVRDLKPGTMIFGASGEVFEVTLTELMDGRNGEPRLFIGGSGKTAIAIKIHFLGREPVIAHPNGDVSLPSGRSIGS